MNIDEYILKVQNLNEKTKRKESTTIPRIRKRISSLNTSNIRRPRRIRFASYYSPKEHRCAKHPKKLHKRETLSDKEFETLEKQRTLIKEALDRAKEVIEIVKKR